MDHLDSQKTAELKSVIGFLLTPIVNPLIPIQSLQEKFVSKAQWIPNIQTMVNDGHCVGILREVGMVVGSLHIAFSIPNLVLSLNKE